MLKEISEITRTPQHTDHSHDHALRADFKRGSVTWLDASDYSKPKLLLHRKPS